jgi:hypothetical protein
MDVAQQGLRLRPMRRMLVGHHPDRSAPRSDLTPLCDGLRGQSRQRGNAEPDAA